jgi:hypothetical protein
MSNALSSGVTGLQAHQKMLDISGNNLANVNIQRQLTLLAGPIHSKWEAE